jgi:hypothetical protein
MEKKSVYFNIRNKLFIPRAKLKTQGYRKHFYGKDGKIEDALSNIETEMTVLIANIIDTEELPKRNSDEHSKLLTFVLLSQQRNPVHAATFNQSTDKLIKLVYGKSEEFKDIIDNFEFGFENASVLGLANLAQLIMVGSDLSLKLLINQTDTPFITSDNPVVKYNMVLEKKGALGGITGIGCIGLQIFLPLSPNHLMLFYDRDCYTVGSPEKKVFVISDKKAVDDINLLHFLNCEESIYFNDEVDESYARLLHSRSASFERANQVLVTEHGVLDKWGKFRPNESIIHTRTTDCKTNLSIPFIKLSSKAKKYEIGTKGGHIRPLPMKMIDAGLVGR